MRPRLLDLFCCAGGAAMGYHRAGFDVVGIDLEPQPNYPFDSHVADALEVLRNADEWVRNIDAIHASPPCQAYSTSSAQARKADADRYPDLIAAVREALVASGLPYVIENVEAAPLENAVRLCGSSFGLPLRRHRLFECSFPILVPACNHGWQTTPRFWTGWRPKGEHRLSTVVQVYGNGGDWHEWGPAMGIDWMQTRHELAEAIPPAYTEFIGRELFWHMAKAQREEAAA
jgi:DNA (cytosine-5)-methyltransferase 1